MKHNNQQQSGKLKSSTSKIRNFVQNNYQKCTSRRLQPQGVEKQVEHYAKDISKIEQIGKFSIKQSNSNQCDKITGKQYIKNGNTNTAKLSTYKQNQLHYFNNSLLLQTHKKSYKANRYRTQKIKQSILNGSCQKLRYSEKDGEIQHSFGLKQQSISKKKQLYQQNQSNHKNSYSLFTHQIQVNASVHGVRETQILLQNQYNQPISPMRKILNWRKQNHSKFAVKQPQFYNNFLESNFRQNLKQTLEVQKKYYLTREPVVNPSNLRQSYASLFQWVCQRLLNLDNLLQKKQISAESANEQQNKIMHSLMDQIAQMLEKQCIQKGLIFKLIHKHFIQKSNLQYLYLNRKAEKQVQKYIQVNNQMIYDHQQQKGKLVSEIDSLKKQKQNRWKNMFMFIKDNRVLRRQKGKLLRSLRIQTNHVKTIREELLKAQKQIQKYKLLLDTYQQEQSHHLKKYIKTNLAIIRLEKIVQQYPRNAKKALMMDLQKLESEELKSLDKKIDFIIKTVNETEVIMDDAADLQETDQNVAKLSFNASCQTEIETLQFGCEYDFYSKIQKKQMHSQARYQGDIDIVSYTVDQIYKPKRKARIAQQFNCNDQNLQNIGNQKFNEASKNSMPKVMLSAVRTTNKKNTLIASGKDTAKQGLRRQYSANLKESKSQQIRNRITGNSKDDKIRKQSKIENKNKQYETQNIIKTYRNSRKKSQIQKNGTNEVKSSYVLADKSNVIQTVFNITIQNNKSFFSGKESKQIILKTVTSVQQSKSIKKVETRLNKKQSTLSNSVQNINKSIGQYQLQPRQLNKNSFLLSLDRNSKVKDQFQQLKQESSRGKQKKNSLGRKSATKSRQKDHEQYRKSRMVTQNLNHYNPDGLCQESPAILEGNLNQQNRRQSKLKARKNNIIKSNRNSIMNIQIHKHSQMRQKLELSDQLNKIQAVQSSCSQIQQSSIANSLENLPQNLIEQRNSQNLQQKILQTQDYPCSKLDQQSYEKIDYKKNSIIVNQQQQSIQIKENKFCRTSQKQKIINQNNEYSIWNAPSSSELISDDNISYKSRSLVDSKSRNLTIKKSALTLANSNIAEKQQENILNKPKHSKHKHFLSGIHQFGNTNQNSGSNNNFSSRFSSLRKNQALNGQFDLISERSQNAIQSEKQEQKYRSSDSQNIKLSSHQDNENYNQSLRHKKIIKKFITEANQDSSSINIVICRANKTSKAIQRISKNSINSKRSILAAGGIRSMFSVVKKVNNRKYNPNEKNNKGKKILSPDFTNDRKRKNVSIIKSPTNQYRYRTEMPIQKDSYLVENEKTAQNLSGKPKNKLGTRQMQKFLIKINKMMYSRRKQILANQQLSFYDFLDSVAKFEYGNTSQVKRFLNSLNSFKTQNLKSIRKRVNSRVTAAQATSRQITQNVPAKKQLVLQVQYNTLDPSMLSRRQISISQTPSSKYLMPMGPNYINAENSYKSLERYSSNEQQIFSNEQFFSTMVSCFNILLDQKIMPQPYLKQLFKVYCLLFEKAIVHMQNGNPAHANSNKVLNNPQLYKIDIKAAKNIVEFVLGRFFSQQSVKRIIDSYNFLSSENKSDQKKQGSSLSQTTTVFQCFLAVQSTLRMASGLRDNSQLIINSSLDYNQQFGVFCSKPTQLHAFLNQALAGLSSKSVVSIGFITQLVYFLPTYRWANRSAMQNYADYCHSNQSSPIFQTTLRIKLQNQCHQKAKKQKTNVIMHKSRNNCIQKQQIISVRDQVKSTYFSKEQQFKAQKYIHLARLKIMANQSSNSNSTSHGINLSLNNQFIDQYQNKCISLHRFHIYCVRHKWQQMLNIMDSIQRQYNQYFGFYLQTEILEYFSIIYKRLYNTLRQNRSQIKYHQPSSKIPWLNSQTQQQLQYFYCFGKPLNKYLLMLTRLSNQIIYINQKLLTTKNSTQNIFPESLNIINFAYMKLKLEQKMDLNVIRINCEQK